MKERGFTRIGFILAAAGSAVGLGNIWKFPYVTGEYGGGAFVLIYLATLALVGLPLLLAEMTTGSLAKKEPVSAYEDLAPAGKKLWRFAGLKLFTGFLILTFYTVVIGWIFYYLFISLTHLPATPQEAQDLFMGMLKGDAATQIFFHAIAMLLIGTIVYKGIKSGIERINLVLMPALIGLLLFLLFYAMGLDSFGEATAFMFAPDFSKLSGEAVMVAVGQAFFSLSIGMAVLMTYGAFVDKKTRLPGAALTVGVMDTAIALVAGVVIFAFLFHLGMEPAQSVGMAFISLPTAFYQFGAAGHLLAVIFFLALAFAGITSAISILEPSVAHLNQRYNISRAKATWGAVLLAYLLGLLVLLSNLKGFEWLSLGERNLFDWLDFLTAAVFLPLGGLAMAIFVGFVTDRERYFQRLHEHGLSRSAFNLWIAALRYMVPLGVVGAIAAKVLGLI
jgi:NSS family neurotransmitter:Na+ symporter